MFNKKYKARIAELEAEVANLNTRLEDNKRIREEMAAQLTKAMEKLIGINQAVESVSPTIKLNAIKEIKNILR